MSEKIKSGGEMESEWGRRGRRRVREREWRGKFKDILRRARRLLAKCQVYWL